TLSRRGRARLATGDGAPDAQDAAAQAVAGPDRVKIADALDFYADVRGEVISSATQMKISIRHLKAFYGEREGEDLRDESLQQAYVNWRFDGNGARPKDNGGKQRPSEPSEGAGASPTP